MDAVMIIKLNISDSNSFQRLYTFMDVICDILYLDSSKCKNTTDFQAIIPQSVNQLNVGNMYICSKMLEYFL